MLGGSLYCSLIYGGRFVLYVHWVIIICMLGRELCLWVEKVFISLFFYLSIAVICVSLGSLIFLWGHGLWRSIGMQCSVLVFLLPRSWWGWFWGKVRSFPPLFCSVGSAYFSPCWWPEGCCLFAPFCSARWYYLAGGPLGLRPLCYTTDYGVDG